MPIELTPEEARIENMYPNVRRCSVCQGAAEHELCGDCLKPKPLKQSIGGYEYSSEFYRDAHES